MTKSDRSALQRRRRSCNLRATVTLAVTIALFSVCAVKGYAVERDPDPGRRLAEQLCAECHRVGLSLLPSPNLDAPPFLLLGNEPALTDAALRALLRTPHVNMPNIILDENQLDEIITYIRSLQAR
jgi:mono/diheme cytochrome c family protein